MQKKELFSKLNKKDYNNQVELILEKKDFSEDTKNLILSMFYKIEIAYNDYKMVKPFAKNKSEFIEEIMKILQEDCNKITLISPREKETEQTINGAIMVYPNIEALLDGLIKCSKNDFYIPSSYSLIKEAFMQFLKVGYCLNDTEVIRDFDGWSWSTDLSKAKNIVYNLVYQNMQILLGSSFFQMWKNDNSILIDYVERILLDLEEIQEKYAHELYVLFCKIILILYIDNPQKEKKITKQIQETKEKLLLMEDKKCFLQNISNQKKEYMKEIKILDKKINNKKELEEEFTRRNETENKIFSLNHLIEILKKERQQIVEKIQECNENIDPRIYTKIMNRLKEDIQIAESLKNNDKEKIELLLEIQRNFLKILKTKIEKIENKKEILEYIYILRYYSFLPITQEKLIKDMEEINLKEVQKVLYTKACNLKMMNIIHKNIHINTEMIHEILDTKIVNLEEIEIKLYLDANMLQIEVYEGEILEGKRSIKIPEEIGALHVKFNKKVKLFN